MVNKILVSSICLLLAACSANYKPNVHSYGELDRTDKTITVDSGNSGLNGSIKRELHKRGWTLKVIENSDQVITRYVMGVSEWDEYGYCGSYLGEKETLLGYDISITDNKTHNEVLTLNGKGCKEDITQQVVNSIEGQ